MPVEIDHMETEVEVLPSERGGPGSAAPIPPQGNHQLKEVLRPIVMELLAEELERYMRSRG